MHPFIKDQNERHLRYAFDDINRILRGLPDSAEINFEEFNTLRNKLSRRKLLANRKNAKKSTGPKTEEGKKRSSKNAIQHGLTAQSDITSIMLEYDGEFNAFQDKMFWQFAPKSEAETLLVDRIVTLAWRLKRIPLMETRMIDWHCKEDAPHAALMWGEARSFVNLSRYEGQLDRCLHRTIKKLEELQANRNVDHFATRTKALVEVEMSRERALDQETRRSVARLRKIGSKKAPSSCAPHPNDNHAKPRAEAEGAASHISPTLSPPRERVGAGNFDTVTSPKRQRRGEGAKEEAKSQPQNEKSETNPPNLNQVQRSKANAVDISDRSDRSDPSDSPHDSRLTTHGSHPNHRKAQKSETNPPNLNQVQHQTTEIGDMSDMSDRSDSPHAQLKVHAPRKSSDKPQATSDISSTLSPPRERVSAGNFDTVTSPKRQRRGEGAKEEAESKPQNEQSEANPPNLNQVQDQTTEIGDMSDMTDESESPHAPRATVHAPRNSSDKPQATSHLLPPLLIQFLDDEDEPNAYIA